MTEILNPNEDCSIAKRERDVLARAFLRLYQTLPTGTVLPEGTQEAAVLALQILDKAQSLPCS